MSKFDWDHIKSSKKDFISGNSIAIIWGIEDVLGRAEEQEIPLTEDEARDILSWMDRKHDADIGINWDTIDCYIDMYVEGRNENN